MVYATGQHIQSISYMAVCWIAVWRMVWHCHACGCVVWCSVVMVCVVLWCVLLSVMWCSVMRCVVVWCGCLWYDVVWRVLVCGAVLYCGVV